MVRCTPDRGSELTLSCMEPQVISTFLMVEVRGGKPVKLPVKGEAVLPAVDVQEATLEFPAEVYTGVVARIPLTVINTTPVVAGGYQSCQPLNEAACEVLAEVNATCPAYAPLKPVGQNNCFG